jgi:hypothetical protein
MGPLVVNTARLGLVIIHRYLIPWTSVRAGLTTVTPTTGLLYTPPAPGILHVAADGIGRGCGVVDLAYVTYEIYRSVSKYIL